MVKHHFEYYKAISGLTLFLKHSVYNVVEKFLRRSEIFQNKVNARTQAFEKWALTIFQFEGSECFTVLDYR